MISDESVPKIWHSFILPLMIKSEIFLAWKDGSVVKSTNCSSKGPEFKSQKPHGGSQPSLKRSDALF